MELVTVASFPSIVDLSLAKACLENHGIECYVRDEHTAQVSEKYKVLTGGIKLEVRTEDAVTATKILAEAGFIQPEEHASSLFWEKLSLTQRFLLFFVLFVIVIGIIWLVQPQRS